MSSGLTWKFVEDHHGSQEYELRASDNHYVLIAWSDRVWATLFDRQPGGDVELVDFFISGADDIASALERVGMPGADASRFGSELWEDLESRRPNGKWSRIRTRLSTLKGRS